MSRNVHIYVIGKYSIEHCTVGLPYMPIHCTCPVSRESTNLACDGGFSTLETPKTNETRKTRPWP